ncbi:hypothetical protein Ahy_A03g011737 [Arachis hypogaea]|uniref:SWIM-type domain-containing protein n=1 Tax=Arachis hypogaea TaxID=3818 RepID=A0A445DRK1_ARAHY|nr:hypothetical protein Ahy_A03g011737 [Arachis hypogaea]
MGLLLLLVGQNLVMAPVQQRKLEDLMKDTKFWTAQWTGDNTCTCNMWQLTGIPCVHALAAIQKRCDRPESYVHPWLKMDAFRATYEHVIKPVNSEEYWEHITNSSNQVASAASFRPPRPKQQILRPHIAPVTTPTPPTKLVSTPRPSTLPTLTPPPTASFALVPRSLHPDQISRVSP